MTNTENTTNDQAPVGPLALARRHSERDYKSSLAIMSRRFGQDENKLYETLRDTVFQGASKSEVAALIIVCARYDLDPFARQIFAFPKKGGGIQPVLSVDGWIKMVNKSAGYDGCEFEMQWQKDGKPFACTCTMHVKHRSHPTRITEYFEECYRDTNDVWKRMPRRMMRHKALKEAARYAFGIEFTDEDEARDIVTSEQAQIVKRGPEFLLGLGSSAKEGNPDPQTISTPAPAAPAAPAAPERGPEPKGKVPIAEKQAARRRRVVRRVEPKQEEFTGTAAPEESVPDDESGTEIENPLKQVIKLMTHDNISEEAILQAAFQQGWIDDQKSSIEEFTPIELLRIATNWPTVLPQLQSMEGGA